MGNRIDDIDCGYGPAHPLTCPCPFTRDLTPCSYCGIIFFVRRLFGPGLPGGRDSMTFSRKLVVGSSWALDIFFDVSEPVAGHRSLFIWPASNLDLDTI